MDQTEDARHLTPQTAPSHPPRDNAARTGALGTANKSSRPPAVTSPVLRVLVGVQDEGMNGIETYAEQVAIAAAIVGHDTTLLVTTPQVAQAVRTRTQWLKLRVVDLGMRPRSQAAVMAERLSPQLQTLRVGKALATMLRDGAPFDVVHLNRPALAPWATQNHARVFVTAWFYPHSPTQRLAETWKHTSGPALRRMVLAAKSVAFYMGDASGYRAADVVVACTETLASQLRDQGVEAVSCPPPVLTSPLGTAAATRDATELQLLICSGDLSHPRKNLQDAVRAAGLLARADRKVVLRAIGRKSESLEACAAGLPAGARLELLGAMPPSEVRREMSRADVFLLPSLYEEWGYVAVESILSGTPVATYPVYPFAEMLSDGLGVVAEDMRPEALAAAIERSLSNVRGSALSEAGDARFGVKTIGMRLTQIWSALEKPASKVEPEIAPEADSDADSVNVASVA